MKTAIIAAYLVWNLAVFLIYGYDKSQARRSAERVSEKFLLSAAAAFGGAGAYAGMQIFRHKTKHGKFIILLPVFAAAQIFIMGFLLSKLAFAG